MALVLEAASIDESHVSAGVSSFSFTYDAGSYTDPLLVVLMAGINGTASRPITACTFNSVGLTSKLVAAIQLNAFSFHTLDIWVLAGATGSHTLACTFAGVTNAACFAAMVSGAHQTVQDGDTSSASSSSSTSPLVTVDSATDQLIIDLVAAASTTGPPTGAVLDGSQTELGNGASGTTTLNILALSSYKAGLTTNTSLGWTLSTARPWFSGGYAIKPAAAAGVSKVLPIQAGQNLGLSPFGGSIQRIR